MSLRQKLALTNYLKAMIKGLHFTTNHPLSLKKIFLSLTILVILVFGAVYSLFAVYGEAEPENVRVTDIYSQSFKVSWTTNKPSKSCVVVQVVGGKFKQKACSDRGTAHLVSLNGFWPANKYELKISSGLKTFSKNLPIVTTTLVNDQPPAGPNPAYGTILTELGDIPVVSALIYISNPQSTTDPVLGAITNADGGWNIDLSPFKNLPDSLDLEIITNTNRYFNQMSTNNYSPFPVLLIN